MAKTIGIVGAAGFIGRDIARDLVEITDHHLILADIREKEVKALAESLGKRTIAVKADIFKPEEMNSLTAGCDVIVNSSGPSDLVVDKVAKAALANNCHYADLAGLSPLYDALAEQDSEIRQRGLTFLIGIGLCPGVSGNFPIFLMSPQFFDRVDSCRTYFAVKAYRMSPGNARDLIVEVVGSAGYPPVWQNGTWVAGPEPSVQRLPPPIGQATVSPMWHREIEDFITALNPRYYALHLCAYTQMSWAALGFILAQKLYQTDEQRWASSRFLSQMQGLESEGQTMWDAFYAEVEGEKDGRPKTLKAVFTGGRPWSSPSCAAAYIKMLAEGEILQKGRHWACQITGSARLFAHIEKLGRKINYLD